MKVNVFYFQGTMKRLQSEEPSQPMVMFTFLNKETVDVMWGDNNVT
jgi:hypothetical protein